MRLSIIEDIFYTINRNSKFFEVANNSMSGDCKTSRTKNLSKNTFQYVLCYRERQQFQPYLVFKGGFKAGEQQFSSKVVNY